MIVGFVGVESVVVGAHVLPKSTYLTKTRSLQFCLLQSAFVPLAQGVAI